MIDNVRIVSEGGVSNGSKVTNAATGEEIQGVTSIDIALHVNDMVRATICLSCVELDIEATPEYHVASPKSGDIKAVRRIEFADGEVVEF